jgi:hypothetical protein
MLGVVLLVVQGFAINRLAGVPYPVWSPNPFSVSAGSPLGSTQAPLPFAFRERLPALRRLYGRLPATTDD